MRIVSRMTDQILAMMNRRPPDALGSELLVTEPWPTNVADIPIDAITFSGGVSEYIYGREAARFGDLGSYLADELSHELALHPVAAEIWDPGQGIRATVIGAAQFSVQTSGNTIQITDPASLPLHNLPVLSLRFDGTGVIQRSDVAASVQWALNAADRLDGDGPIALAFPWHGDPLHARLEAVAQGLSDALPKTIAAGHPLILLIDGDIGKSLGRILHFDVAPRSNVIAIDGVQLKHFDYVDIGSVIDASKVVIVIIKSLLFR